MRKVILYVLGVFVAIIVFIIACATPPVDIIDLGPASITLTFKNSQDQVISGVSLIDTVGKTIKVGVKPYLYSQIDSVVIMLGNPRDSGDTIAIKTFTSDDEISWSSFTFTKVMACSVYVKAYINTGVTISVSGYVSIVGKPIDVTIQPLQQTCIVDSTATISVTVDGDGPLTYQWFHESSQLTGENKTSLVKTHLALADSGKYKCRVIDKWDDTAFSAVAKLSVVPKNIIIINTRPTLVRVVRFPYQSPIRIQVKHRQIRFLKVRQAVLFRTTGFYGRPQKALSGPTLLFLLPRMMAYRNCPIPKR
jgi:Immunoglobulin I-set domain